MKKVIMVYGKACLESKPMLRLIKGLNFGNRYKFEFSVINKKKKNILKEQFHKAIESWNEEEQILFIDTEANKVIFANDFERLMSGLEGERWWKN